jgi:hypothetical protein
MWHTVITTQDRYDIYVQNNKLSKYQKRAYYAGVWLLGKPSATKRVYYFVLVFMAAFCAGILQSIDLL